MTTITDVATKTLDWLQLPNTQKKYEFTMNKVGGKFYIDSKEIKTNITDIRQSIRNSLNKVSGSMMNKRLLMIEEIVKNVNDDLCEYSKIVKEYGINKTLDERLTDSGFIVQDEFLYYPNPIPIVYISDKQGLITEIDSEIQNLLINYGIHGITDFKIHRQPKIHEIHTKGIHPNSKNGLFCISDLPLKYTYENIMGIRESMSWINLGSYYYEFYDYGSDSHKINGLELTEKIDELSKFKKEKITPIHKLGLITNNNKGGGRIYVVK